MFDAQHPSLGDAEGAVRSPLAPLIDMGFLLVCALLAGATWTSWDARVESLLPKDSH